MPSDPDYPRRHPASSEARRRHPANGSWRPDVAAVAAVLLARAPAGGRAAPRYPETAAAVLTARGLSGLGAASFAETTGLRRMDLARLERGELPPAAVPGRVRAMSPTIRWDGLDAGPGPAGAAVAGHPRLDGGRAG